MEAKDVGGFFSGGCRRGRDYGFSVEAYAPGRLDGGYDPRGSQHHQHGDEH
jgi:hypothetical protein